jgi:hypothetical protein
LGCRLELIASSIAGRGLKRALGSVLKDAGIGLQF